MRTGWVEKREGVKGTSWRVRYWIDGPSGAPIAKSKSFGEWTYGGKKAAESAATLHLAKMLTTVADGSFIQPVETTLAQLVEQWLQSKAGSIKASTLVSYRGALAHLSPDVGNLPVQRLKAVHLDALYNRLRVQGVGSSLIRILAMLIKGALAQGVRWELLHRNPAAAVKRPEHTVRTAAPWSLDECALFLEREGDHPRFGLIWRLAALTGMRRGELLALRWSDIDLTRQTISISRTLTRVTSSTERVGASPKTANSVRTIPLPASCVAPLKAHRVRQLEQRVAATSWHTGDGELLFTSRTGRALSSVYVAKVFHEAGDRCGLRAVPMHSLRHGYATGLMALGVNPKVAADLLGDSVVTVLRIYSHSSSDSRGDAAKRFDDMVAALGSGDRERNASTT